MDENARSVNEQENTEESAALTETESEKIQNEADTSKSKKKKTKKAAKKKPNQNLMGASFAQRKKAKERKRMKKLIAFFAVLYLLIVYWFCHVGYVAFPANGYHRVNIFSASFQHMFTHPFTLFPTATWTLSIILLVTVAIAAAIAFIVFQMNIMKHDNDETVNGSAHFMTKEEMADYNERCTTPFESPEKTGFNNMIISKDIYLSLDWKRTFLNCNMLIIGASGAGKTRYFASPNILQYNSNFVITDPSGEIFRDYGKALEDHGYKVKTFNIVDFARSSRYNPFHYIREEKDVFTIVNAFMENTTAPGKKGGDAFWDDSTKLLLTALMLYIWHVLPPEKQTMSKIIDMINLSDINENDSTTKSPLDQLFDQLESEDPENLAVQQYKLFKLGAGKTLKSILISAGVRLQQFKLSDVKDLTSWDDLEFESFSDTKQALFVIIPTAETSFNYIVSMMYTQMFTSLYYYAENEQRYGWAAITPDNTSVFVSKARTKDDSPNAEKEVKAFVNAIKSKIYIEEDTKKKLFNIYTDFNGVKTLVAWRGQREWAEEFCKELKNVKAVPLKERNGCLLNHVRFILDEFANIGSIPAFNEKLATIRKYNISCSIIIQGLGQLKKMYKDDWSVLVGNCDTKLDLGCSDQETNEWLVKQLGKKTTRVKNESFSHNEKAGGTVSIQKSSRELMTIDELAGMAPNECLVIIRKEPPHRGLKYELTDHPEYQYAKEHSDMFVFDREPVKSNSNIPLRERKKQAEEQNASTESGEAKQPITETPTSQTPPAPAPAPAKKPAENPTAPPMTIKDAEKRKRDARNYAAKTEAKAAENAVKAIEEEEMVLAGFDDKSIFESFANAMNINIDSSSEEILEELESRIIFDDPSQDEISYMLKSN